jgi:phenylacetate-CoA ligase
MRLRDTLFLAELLQNQWRKPGDLKKLQDRKLRQLVRHAYDQVPFYQRLLDAAGVHPDDIAGVQDLPKLPVASREDLVSSPPEEILAQGLDIQHCPRSVTSGSTGIPLTIFHRRQDLTRMNLGWGRVYLINGVKPWHRMAGFTGQPAAPARRSWYEYLGLMQRKMLSTWDDPGQWIAELRNWQPQALTGYVMTLKLLASAMQAQGVDNIRPNVVFQSSGLLDDASRQFLHSVFQAPIVDIYGSAEAGCIAWQCASCGAYHISADLVLVELLDDSTPAAAGQAGEIVVTNLHSYAMPFIRYRQGDVGRWAEGSSRCGRALPLLEVVEGRLGDLIALPSGKTFSPHPFFVALDTTIGVAKWRLIQETPSRLKVEMVAGTRAGDHAAQAAQANVQAIVGEEAEVVVCQVNRLPYDPGHKFRSVVSQVHQSTAAQRRGKQHGE